MKSVLEMAGNFASHAIWSVSDGETLIPIVGYLSNDGRKRMERLAMDPAEAVEVGEQALNQSLDINKGVAFIKDALVTLDTGRTDALVVDVTFGEDRSKRAQFLIPYRNASHQKGFAVHRLKITEAEGFMSQDYDWISESFFTGLESHSEGGKIWAEQYEDQAGEEDSQSDGNTAQDFEILKRSPFLIFLMVAAADGNIDNKEVTEFMKILSNPDSLNNSLLTAVINSVIDDAHAIVSEMGSSDIDFAAELGVLKLKVETMLSPELATQFKLSLLLLGKQIAEASGGFFGLGSKIDKSEKAALATIALYLDIQV